jgi:hypothetical protein
MTVTAFTPGPWKVGDCDGTIIWARRFRSTDIIECPDTPDEGVSVGNAYGLSDRAREQFGLEEGWAVRDEQKANALLMAAAPDLYSALEELANCVERSLDGAGIDSQRYEAARVAAVAALAKARGEQ